MVIPALPPNDLPSPQPELSDRILRLSSKDAMAFHFVDHGSSDYPIGIDHRFLVDRFKFHKTDLKSCQKAMSGLVDFQGLAQPDLVFRHNVKPTVFDISHPTLAFAKVFS